ncbi:MAG: hypothetical protein ACJ8G7_19905 [Rhizobacter sp.]
MPELLVLDRMCFACLALACFALAWRVDFDDFADVPEDVCCVALALPDGFGLSPAALLWASAEAATSTPVAATAIQEGIRRFMTMLLSFARA